MSFIAIDDRDLVPRLRRGTVREGVALPLKCCGTAMWANPLVKMAEPGGARDTAEPCREEWILRQADTVIIQKNDKPLIASRQLPKQSALKCSQKKN